MAQLVVDLGAPQVEQLCHLFAENARREVDAVSEALDAGDGERAARSAHRLKSASGFLGATGLVALCAEVEAGARGPALAEQLAGELKQTAAALDLSVGRLAQ